MPDAALEAAEEALVDLSASLATRNSSAVRAALEEARAVAEPLAIEEALLQAHLFVGFPDVLNALQLWREMSGLPPTAAEAEGSAGWEERGARVCSVVYGSNYDRLRDNVALLHPDLERWMLVGGYGRVIGRPGLSLLVRELCTAALLVVWGVPRQLHSHLRGALNAGARVDQVERAVEIASRRASPENRDGAWMLWRRIRDAQREG